MAVVAVEMGHQKVNSNPKEMAWEWFHRWWWMRSGIVM